MRARRVVDVQIEVDLLRAPLGPVGRDMVGCELHADHPLPVGVEDAVPGVVGEHLAVEHARREGALSGEVHRVKHDHLSHELHSHIMAVHVSPFGRASVIAVPDPCPRRPDRHDDQA